MTKATGEPPRAAPENEIIMNKLVIATILSAALLPACSKDKANATATPGAADASAIGDDAAAGAASDEDEASAFASEDDDAAAAAADGEGAEAEASVEDPE